MKRTAAILAHFETTLTASPRALGHRFSVGTKTIGNDIAQLNELLEPAASIRLDNGRYRLLVLDPAAYADLRDRLRGEESFNDPDYRSGFLFARLLFSDVPVRIDEFTVAMNVSRTTVVADLARLRQELAPYELGIQGRPHVGLALTGAELQIRLFVLEQAYQVAYGRYPLDDEVLERVLDVAREHHLNEAATRTLVRWFTVMIDRHLTGHPLTGLPPEYDDLEQTPAHRFAAAVAGRVGPLVGTTFPEAEVLFLALPAAGMRTPSDERGLSVFPANAAMEGLVGTILGEIRHEMDLDVVPGELLREFVHHVTFMLNRMRYRIRLEEPVDADLQNEFPVAHTMATVAKRVIERETGLVVADSELGFMTTYFQVFLEEHASRGRDSLSVGIVTGTGRVAAHLIRLQLQKVLAPGATFRHLAAADLSPESLAGIDLVVATPGQEIATDLPVIQLRPVFDGGEVLRQINRARASRRNVPLAGAPRSLVVSLLDADRFIPLEQGVDYERGLAAMLARLVETGLVSDSFLDALVEREARSTMQLDEFVAFPHTTIEGVRDVLFAMGVIPRRPDDAGVRVIFLMGVPTKHSYDDTLLIDVYDEIIRLAGDHRLLDRISRVTTYEQFFYLMEDRRPSSNDQ